MEAPGEGLDEEAATHLHVQEAVGDALLAPAC